MFQAQYLKGGVDVYSPWLDRGGDFLLATVDLVDNGSSSLTVRVFTKDRDQTGDGVDADAGTTIFANSSGRVSAEWGPNSLKELVRYKFTVSTALNGWVLFRMLNPIWFDAVDAS